MKGKKKPREIRSEEARKRRILWSGEPASAAAKPDPPENRTAAHRPRQLTPQEQAEQEAAETREFLAYLEKETRVIKEEDSAPRRPARQELTGTLNLESGMPVLDEAVSRLNVGLQEMKSRRVRIVRLIHGYGSTGRGGILRVGIREELNRLKKRRGIREYIPGEDFGPFHEASRRLVDQYPALTRDQDYGKCNQGITIVVL